MSIHIFGKGDDLVVPHLYPTATPFGSEISYTDPSYDWLYSKYGFVIPIDYESVPYEVIMENRFPVMSPNIKRFEADCKYILVDHHGQIWSVMTAKVKGEIQLSYAYIHKTDKSWWLNRESDDNNNFDKDFLLGLLSSGVDRKKIDKTYQEYYLGRKLLWLSISEIVEKLNREFPLEKPEEVLELSEEDKTDQALKRLSDLIL